MKVPASLRTWFVIHFWVDFLVAIPLFVAPVWATELLGFEAVDPLFGRLVAAALFAIGGTSLLVRDTTVEIYRALLALKTIWSSAAIVALVLALFLNPPSIGLFGALGLFVVFSFVWRYYARRLI